jgi:hypothetical protein
VLEVSLSEMDKEFIRMMGRAAEAALAKDEQETEVGRSGWNTLLQRMYKAIDSWEYAIGRSRAVSSTFSVSCASVVQKHRRTTPCLPINSQRLGAHVYSRLFIS